MDLKSRSSTKTNSSSFAGYQHDLNVFIQEKAKNYAPLLDEKFLMDSVTGILERPGLITKEQFDGFSEVLIMNLELSGFVKYNSVSGYKQGASAIG
jgi:hypothetical protein